VLLDVDFLLELGAVAHLHELVGVAGVTIFAGELAAAVRVDGPGEGQAAWLTQRFSSDLAGRVKYST
jgi:hypothetical protein